MGIFLPGDVMKKLLPLLLALLLLWGCAAQEPSPETAAPSQAAVPVPPETQPAQVYIPILPLPAPEPAHHFSAEEKQMLLKIAMAERGYSGCTECTALVMQTILNRVKADRFGSSIRSVLFAPEQFTPVMDGSYDTARPNELCYDAMDLLLSGWDESQGALSFLNVHFVSVMSCIRIYKDE